MSIAGTSFCGYRRRVLRRYRPVQRSSPHGLLVNSHDRSSQARASFEGGAGTAAGTRLRQGQPSHPAVESAISCLKHRGLDRVRSHGRDGFARTVALAVPVANCCRLGRLLRKRQRMRNRKRLRRCAVCPPPPYRNSGFLPARRRMSINS